MENKLVEAWGQWRIFLRLNLVCPICKDVEPMLLINKSEPLPTVSVLSSEGLLKSEGLCFWCYMSIGATVGIPNLVFISSIGFSHHCCKLGRRMSALEWLIKFVVLVKSYMTSFPTYIWHLRWFLEAYCPWFGLVACVFCGTLEGLACQGFDVGRVVCMGGFFFLVRG